MTSLGPAARTGLERRNACGCRREERSARRPASSRKIVSRAGVVCGLTRPDRLPGLQMIFGQLPRVMVEEIGNLSLLPLKVRLLELVASTIGETCTLPPNTLAGVVRAERWRSWVYFISDPLATRCSSRPRPAAKAFHRRPCAAGADQDRRQSDACPLPSRRAIVDDRFFAACRYVTFDVGAVVEKIELEPQLRPVDHQSLPLACRSRICRAMQVVVTIVIPSPPSNRFAICLQARRRRAVKCRGAAVQISRRRFAVVEASSQRKSPGRSSSSTACSRNGRSRSEKFSVCGRLRRRALQHVVSRVRLDADEKPALLVRARKARRRADPAR